MIVSLGSVIWVVWWVGLVLGVIRVRYVILYFVFFEKKCIFVYWLNIDIFLNWFMKLLNKFLKKLKKNIIYVSIGI